jgi:hypothetical protein
MAQRLMSPLALTRSVLIEAQTPVSIPSPVSSSAQEVVQLQVRQALRGQTWDSPGSLGTVGWSGWLLTWCMNRSSGSSRPRRAHHTGLGRRFGACSLFARCIRFGNFLFWLLC